VKLLLPVRALAPVVKPPFSVFFLNPDYSHSKLFLKQKTLSRMGI